MDYDAESDLFICQNGKKLKMSGTKFVKSKTGYKSEKTIYICEDYSDCNYKNKCIKAEGSFAQLKHDMNFRRFMCRGQNNVLAESILLAVAHNINKLHNKIQANRTGKHLFELKKTA